MKKTLILITLSVLTLTLLPMGGTVSHGVSPAGFGGAPVPAPVLTPPCDDGIDSIGVCPNTGCGENGDALLNQAKNRFDLATGSATMTLQQMRALPQPLHWNTGQSRSSIQGTGREGSIVTVKGFLLKVKPEGGESCNCGLTRRVDTDVHFALVSDIEDAENLSITAEVSPRVRAQSHPGWLYKDLKDLESDYVKVKGFLMLDTKHISQGHRLPGERANHGLQRATNWEIHPITQLWICTKSKHACDHGSGWQEVP